MTALATVLTKLAWGGWWVTLATSLAVQILAALVETAFGLLLPYAWLACVLTVTVPLSVYLVLSQSGLVWLSLFGPFRGVFDPSHGRADWAH